MEKNESDNDKHKAFDHVVVLMLENRSFDNLLGYLYKPDELSALDKAGKLPLGKSFDGLHFNGEHCNPIPDDLKKAAGVNRICVTPAKSYHQPFPDPGETYPHVNTQLYGTINPPCNSGVPDNEIKPPYNLPHIPLPHPAPMNGFIKDYISVLRSLKKKKCWQKILNFLGLNPLNFKPDASCDEYKVIMECFEPCQVNVLATLAKQFAVFDHWYCDVPTQTYSNRSFWHAASSNGHVNNDPKLHWIFDNNEETLFNRLKENALSWNIYTDNPISLTGIIHFQPLLGFHHTNFKSFKQFLGDAKNGKLPKYSFIEPRFFTPHNDQHPSIFDSELYKPSSVGSVLMGEILINDVYNAIRKSDYWKNTLLIITHDEHGGTYDHVSPPNAVPPSDKPVHHQDNFSFNRLGVRVPMVMVSAHIKPHTIVNEPKHHTSFLRTLCQEWDLGHFTCRDKNAPEFTEVFTADTRRDVSDWPDIPYPLLPPEWHKTDFSNAPLNRLQRDILESAAIYKKKDVKKMKTVGDAMRFFQSFDDLPGAKMEELTHTGFKSQMDR